MKALPLLFLLAVSSFAQESLNKMSREEYFKFNQTVALDYKNDPDDTGRQAEQVVIVMAGWDDKPDAHKVLKVDVVFNVNTMLLLVANANNIKRNADFIKEYKVEAAGVEKQLTGEALLYHLALTRLLISENEKLP